MMKKIEITYTNNGFSFTQKGEEFASRRELIDYMTYVMERHNFNSGIAMEVETGELLASVEW